MNSNESIIDKLKKSTIDMTMPELVEYLNDRDENEEVLIIFDEQEVSYGKKTKA